MAPARRSPASEQDTGAFTILDRTIEAGSVSRIGMRSSETFAGVNVETPVIVVHGREAGPVLCVIAGVHGDEINGVEVVRRAVRTVSPNTLKGTLVAVPIANIPAFRRGSRYLPDRRDLNRHFPGSIFGSSASRIAYRLFEGVVRSCDSLVDLHTGSFHRSNLHQLRADLSDPPTLKLASDFGATVIVNNAGREGTLRRAATDAGIPAITVEAGEPTRFDESQVVQALSGLLRLMSARGMIEGAWAESPKTPAVAYLATRWIRSDQGGILVSRAALGDQIAEGQTLGIITDPLSGDSESIVSPVAGRLIGMALDQVVMPGFAAYHIGLEPRPMSDTGDVEPTQFEHFESYDPEGLDLEERPE